ncbi:MAG: hypothetical protein JRF27_08985 [Deltaproteobacteria bacterium]|nr:hypothetical protein [Deltaproteobacteria bacterium]
MTHEDSGHYAKKHPDGTTADPEIAEFVEKNLESGKISCAAAHKVAQELNVSPAEVGKTIDLVELRISKCQLGLFGYEPEKKIVTPVATVAPEIRDAIEASMIAGRLSCVSSWELAERFSLSKMKISAACEAMGVKVNPCQLGAF